MQGVARSDIFLFEDFRLDRRGGLFQCNGVGRNEPVAIGSRALDILFVLIERAGEVVTKDEIIAAVWPETVVEDSNLTVQISALRRVLDRGRPNGSCIQTVPGRGYRFAAAVTPFSHQACSGASPVHGAGEIEHEKTVENLVPAVTANTARPGVAADLPLRKLAAARRRLRADLLALTAAMAVAMVSAIGAWWLSPTTEFSATRTARVATPMALPRVAPRMSIVVLPFANFGSDPDQQSFADGIADHLTTALSSIPNSFVISHNTASIYRYKPTDTKEIGRALGVRYVLEGGVHRWGNNVRVNARLIDAATDAQLWARSFDSDSDDVPALQNDLISQLVFAVNTELLAAEAARPSEHPDALDYLLRGRAARIRPNSRAKFAETIPLFEHALALAPDPAEAQAWLADMLAQGSGMSSSPAADIARAEGLVEQALAASPRSPIAHLAKAQVLRMGRNRCREAIPEYEMARAFSHLRSLLNGIGQCKLFLGDPEEAILLFKQAIRLSPADHEIGGWYWQMGRAHLLQSRVDEATYWLEKARSAMPEAFYVHAYLASAYGLTGDSERAKAELAEARRLRGEGSFSSLARERAGLSRTYFDVPKVRAWFEAAYLAGLRKAGVPEE
jgi:TolB-like protein/DNA-binding winged helix-turn-helix (wHTH) protein/Flp pilus assembly protein TadD